jgi:two-component system, chemotaxis family, sensor kinase Cph1
MKGEVVTAKNVDLFNCDREQVQFSGAVQPHGCMLVIEQPSLRILQASANCFDLLGFSLEEAGETRLSAVLPFRIDDIALRLSTQTLDNGPVHLVHLKAEDTHTGRPLHVFGHRCGGVTILEFEIMPDDIGWPMLDLYSDLRATMAQLHAAPSLQAFFDLAVAQIRRFTGFERVMAYKFLEDGSGHVIAESTAESFQSYLGLHYPATDIPAPARRLFALSWLRHLPNVDYTPIPLIPEFSPQTGAPVDLSYAILRSVSVMYTGYLRNMGVKASMVMPLMKDGVLWGLLACNHESAPRHVPYEIRMAAEFLAHMISLTMSSKEDAESSDYRSHMKDVLGRLMRALQANSDIHAALCSNPDANISHFIEAGGAALVTEGQISKFGETPSDQQLRELAVWLAASDDLILASDCLPEHNSDAAQYVEIAAGVLAVRLSKRRPDYAMWFRPEQAHTVKWAGDPAKPVEINEIDGSIRLSPRASFAIWKESVEGRSKPWTACEIEAAADLRWGIVEIILARAEETELINRKLRDVNSELDSFAYVASHDLKEPLRGISHLATFIQRKQGDANQHLETIMKLIRRMDDLIESLLQYSRTGRVELVLEEVDLDAVVDEALQMLTKRIAGSGVVIRRPGKLPVVRADRVRLREVLVNLISNAIKYNDKDQRWVEIGVEPGRPNTIYVRDNGIGVEPQNHSKIFEIFRRLHGRDEFGGGTGAGLTIARKAIERHGGRIFLTSAPGEGATFFFTLQEERPPP